MTENSTHHADSSQLLQTPFYAFHESNGARFVDFAGWAMPIHYGSILAEHHQVRNTGGVFDVSHMGRLTFAGKDARRFLERILTRRVSDMTPGSCRYSMVCNEAGGVKDDVIVYRHEDNWLMVVNASNRMKLIDHFNAEIASGGWQVKMNDTTMKTAMIAAQGPKVIEQIGRFSSEVPALKRYRFCVKQLLLVKLTISRTGYTGEDGVEVILPANLATMAFKMLQGSGAQADIFKPAGLGARDTLRLEAGMPLYGHELDEQTDPLAAGLNFAVNLDKTEHAEFTDIPEFIGQQALKAIATGGLRKQLVGLKCDGKRTPRQGMKVLAGDREVGEITSGCLSPTLGYPIAMAYVESGTADEGQSLNIVMGRNTVEAAIVKLPFYKK